jgi:hypothetical protein
MHCKSCCMDFHGCLTQARLELQPKVQSATLPGVIATVNGLMSPCDLSDLVEFNNVLTPDRLGDHPCLLNNSKRVQRLI